MPAYVVDDHPGGGTLDIYAQVSDVLSLPSTSSQTTGCNSYVYLISQHNQFRLAYFSPFAGNLWKASIFVQTLSEGGAWTPYVQLCDTAGNSRFIDLNAMPTGTKAPFFFYPSPAADGQIMPGKLTVVDSQVGNQAQVTVPSVSSVADPNGAPISDPKVSIDIYNCFVNSLDPTCKNPSFPNFQTNGSVFTSIVFKDSQGNAIPGAKVQCTGGLTGASITIPLNIAAPVPDDPTKPWNLKYLDKQTGGFVNAKDCLNPSIDIIGQVGANRLSVTFDHVSQFSVFLAAQRISLPGDLNDDGKVDCADVAIVRAAFGKRPGQPGWDPRADINGDSVISIQDLAAVSQKLPPGAVCR